MNIEDITRDDILDALNIIKTVCYNNICDVCPFSVRAACHIKAGDPEDWAIEDYSNWRAFKR